MRERERKRERETDRQTVRERERETETGRSREKERVTPSDGRKTPRKLLVKPRGTYVAINRKSQLRNKVKSISFDVRETHPQQRVSPFEDFTVLE